MRRRIRLDLALSSVLLTAVLVASAPAIADRIVRYARNADRVDGFHAVEAGSDQRARRLVATNRRGLLPNDIIARARNASRLDGFDSTSFLRNCGRGSVLAWATVPGTVNVTEDYISSASSNPPGFNCADAEQRVLYRRTDTGTYRVKFPGFEDNTDDMYLGNALVAQLTVIRGQDSPAGLTASYAVIKDDGGSTVLEVTVSNGDGAPTNASFSVALLHGTP